MRFKNEAVFIPVHGCPVECSDAVIVSRIRICRATAQKNGYTPCVAGKSSAVERSPTIDVGNCNTHVFDFMVVKDEIEIEDVGSAHASS